MLIQKFQRYVIKTGGHASNTGSRDGNVAIEQYSAGNMAAGISVLEIKLCGAGIELPAHG
ncbi:hypothetical protein [Reyranella sp.]|uniref:hypothetical protein n=1 Tax=Reyranella sp. TaxID=1929291 RepID=UPI003D0D90AE